MIQHGASSKAAALLLSEASPLDTQADGANPRELNAERAQADPAKHWPKVFTGTKEQPMTAVDIRARFREDGQVVLRPPGTQQ